MSNSLPLLLERAINSSRRSSSLELPLDRKLGELSRYTYVYGDALPLRMERRISEQPAPNALTLAMTNPRGVLMPPRYVTSNALPLPLSVLISEQPAANVLPLGMSRKLGTIFGVPVIVPPTDPTDPTDPVDPEPPLEYAPPMTALASYISSDITGVHGISHCRDWHHNGRDIANDRDVIRTDVVNIAQRYSMQMRGLIPIANDAFTLTSQVFELARDARISYIAFIPIYNERQFKHSSTIGYTRCVKAHSAKVAQYRNCKTLPLQSAVNFATSVGHKVTGVGISRCQSTKVQHAVLVPDRYYPIPIPPPVKPPNVCRIRPPSSELPLRMSRQRRGLLSSNLPLSLTCWHDDPPPVVPNLRSYIVHNIITANIGGIAIDPLSFGIKTDMDGYYWQGNIAITAKDYAKIKAKLDVPRGSEPMINVTVNGFLLSFIAEDQQRSRQFAQQTYSLSGRSITARLGADYAVSQGGLIDQASYVSQIAAQQLNGLSISILDWDINDWLVPADAYSVAGKTPIAVLADIAKAAGGFLMSHPSEPTVSLKPRWKVAAWDMATATPDVIVPADVIRQINDQKRVNPRYNTVRLNSASDGAEVYRQAQGRDAEASTQDHPLYTDRDAMLPAGIAILSDSGTHGDYTLKLRWADKYNLPLAQLGEIWQFNDPEGAWRGVITGVSVDVDQDNDAPTVWQSISVDRYLDA